MIDLRGKEKKRNVDDKCIETIVLQFVNIFAAGVGFTVIRVTTTIWKVTFSHHFCLESISKIVVNRKQWK